MPRCDEDFCRARAQEEYARAQMATNDCARRIHLELARLYTERLYGGASMEPREHVPQNWARPGWRIFLS